VRRKIITTKKIGKSNSENEGDVFSNYIKEYYLLDFFELKEYQ
jgi:hypothetical protein